MAKLTFAITAYDGFVNVKWRNDISSFKELEKEQEKWRGKGEAVALCRYPTFSPIRGDYELCDLVNSTIGELGSVGEALERLLQKTFEMGSAYARGENVQKIAEG